MKVHALILAAGFSTRMEPHFKPLLPLPLSEGRVSALAAVCRLYQKEGVSPIVVGGNRAEDTKREAEGLGAAFALNAHPERGMFSSIRAGVAALPPDGTHFFVHPVDIPLVRRMTVRTLLEQAETSGDRPLIPCYRGENGHPPLFPASLARAVLAAGDDGCLRDMVTSASPLSVPVADSFILRDMDSPEDYSALCSLAPGQDTLSPEEALELLDVRHVPDIGKRHCLAVGAVAERFAQVLNEARASRGQTPLNPSLAKAGGFVHDICKGERCHEAAAGRLLRTCGLVRMATLVEAHRDMTLPDNLPFTERELVFLADKYVRGKWPVTLEERFHSKMELFAGDDAAVAAIDGRMKRAQAMAVRLAEECGRAPAELAREALAE